MVFKSVLNFLNSIKYMKFKDKIYALEASPLLIFINTKINNCYVIRSNDIHFVFTLEMVFS